MSESLTDARARRSIWRSGAAQIAAAVIVALTLVRVVVLFTSFIDLAPDEAQYWSWSRHLAFGYFSKPPMIAWLIAGSTALCGDGEACVRLSSPLLHGGIAFLIFFLARRLYDERVALWSSIAYATMPVVSFSSGLITTDVPLVFFWTTALLLLDRTIAASAEGRGGDALKLAALTGLAIGLGLLAKYAMIYFVLCTAIHAAISPQARRAILSPAGLLIGVAAFAVYAPNLVWNAREGFATFGHTASNANWGAELFNPRKLAEFLLSQVGVFGPIMTALFLFGLLTLKRRVTPEFARSDVLLLTYSLPIFIIMFAQAFISRANANWAAPAFVAVDILTVAWIFRIGMRRLFNVSLAIHVMAAGVLYAFITIPGFIEMCGVESAFKRGRGWDTLGRRVEELTSKGEYHAIVSDDRELIAELVYYARGSELPIVIFDLDGKPQNEFELESPYQPSLGDPVLLVPRFADDRVSKYFSEAVPVEVFRMEQGGRIHYDFHIMRLAGFKGTS